MTTNLDTRPTTTPAPLQLGEIAPGTPVYLVADNPWVPWSNRAAGAASGTWLAAAVTYLLTPSLLTWALASAIAMTLLFAWVLGGREAYDRMPKKFKKAA